MFWKRKKKANRVPSDHTRDVDYQAIALSDVGNVRDHNEDRLLFVRPAEAEVRQEKGFLALVADGMGGHAAGEVAAGMATETISQIYYAQHDSPMKSLQAATQKANEVIFQLATQNASHKGMGTTCTCVAIVDRRMLVAHIGDSRAYLLQKGQIFRLTRDDTYVQELVDAGKLDPIDALQHPQRNVLSKALGTSASRTVAVYESELELGPDDILMLCTDGLYEYFSQQEILELLSEMPFRDVGQRMIALAKERGGHDNLSLLLVRKAPEVLTGQQPTQTQKIELS